MIYTYRCDECEHEFDKLVKHMQDHVECPLCGSGVTRQLSIPAVHFKGRGFYETDFKGK